MIYACINGCFCLWMVEKEEIHNNYSHLSKENQRQTVFELLVLRLVVPRFHSQPRAYASAKHGQPDECRLRYPPPGAFRLPFVNAVQKERDDIDCGKIYQNYMEPVQLRHESTDSGNQSPPKHPSPNR